MPDSMTLQHEVNSLLYRAEAFVRQGRLTEADQCFVKAVTQDPSPKSRIAFGSSLAEREEYNAAIHQMTGALDVATLQADRQALAATYHNLAAVYRELGDYELATRFQQRAILQLDDCGSEELLGLANDAWLAGRPQLAASLADSSAELAEADDPSVEAEAMLGVLCGISGDARSGIRFLIKAYRCHRDQSAYRLMGIDLMNMATLFGEIGWHRTEIAIVRDAISLFDRVSARVSSARAQQVLALLTQVQGIRTFDPMRN